MDDSTTARPRRFLSTGMVARRLGVCRETAHRWIRTGRIPSTRTLGGHHRVRPEDLEAALAAAGRRAASG